MADTKKSETKKEVFEGVVVPKEGLKIGTKKTKHYKKGEKFSTDKESLYLNLIKQQKIK